jgi:hypothetical protein
MSNLYPLGADNEECFFATLHSKQDVYRPPFHAGASAGRCDYSDALRHRLGAEGLGNTMMLGVLPIARTLGQIRQPSRIAVIVCQ